MEARPEYPRPPNNAPTPSKQFAAVWRVRSVNGLGDVLKAGEEDPLMERLGKLVDSLQSVRTAVEGQVAILSARLPFC